MNPTFLRNFVRKNGLRFAPNVRLSVWICHPKDKTAGSTYVNDARALIRTQCCFSTTKDRWDDEISDESMTRDSLYEHQEDHKHTSRHSAKEQQNSRVDAKQRLSFPRNSNLFQRVDILLSTPLGQLHPLDMKYTCLHILGDCCKLNTIVGMEKSMLILTRLLNDKKKKNDRLLHHNGDLQTIQPTPLQNPLQRLTIVPRYPFHLVMYGFVQLAGKKKLAVEQCKTLLQLMWEEYSYDTQQQDNLRQHTSSLSILEDASSCRPMLHDYNTLLTAFAYATKWDPNNIPKEAEKMVMSTMIQLSHTYPDLYPDTTSFNKVIQCYANSSTYHAGHSAQSVLGKMQEVTIRPDIRSYTGVISAFANSNGYQSSQHAEAILFDIVKKAQHYELCKEGVANIREQEDGITTEDTLIRDPLIEPDNVMFTSCIQAWVNAAKHYGRSPKARFEAAQQAEKILNIMYELAAQWEKDTLQYEQELANPQPQRKNPFIPDLVCWNTVLTGWAKSDTKEAAPRAQQLLDEMMDLAKQSVLSESGLTILPDRNSFHIVMDAWARYAKYDTDSAQKAENLITQMYDLYHSGRFTDSIKPNSTSYIIAMKAWARSEYNKNSTSVHDIPFKVHKCRDLLDRMIEKFDSGEEDVKPNIVAYTSILNSIVHTPRITSTVNDDNSIVSVAFKTYREILQDPNDLGLKPDDIVFSSMLQVLRKQLDETGEARRFHTEQVFDDACQAGHVSSAVVRELVSTCPSPDLLERLIGRRKIDPSDSLKFLPREWTKNVRTSSSK